MATIALSQEDAEILVNRQEGHFWDHKDRNSRGATIQKLATALANADGGEFTVGIIDHNKGLVGLGRWNGFDEEEEAQFVYEAVARDVDPAVPYSIDFLVVDGREDLGAVALVSVQKSESVHRTSKDEVWVRRGASSVRISGQDVTNLTLAKGARSYEDQLLGDYDARDLTGEAELEFFLRDYSPATEPLDFVEKQRLVDRDSGAARVAAAVLYAEVPAAVMPKRCGIKVARYETKEDVPRREHLKETPVSIDAPARTAIDEAIERVSEMIEAVSVLQADGSMAPVRYPPEALKEIIVNAIIHRDYNLSDDILVFVFDDRVEVRSPGVLPGHMTLENLYTDRFSRNPTIVRLLNKYPDPPNKDIGEGLTTVRAKMQEARLKEPEFEIEGNYFVVRLGHTPLGRPEEIVLEYLKSHSEITNSTGRDLTGIRSENTMKEVFYSLRKLGQIQMVEGKKGSASAWEMTNQDTLFDNEEE